MWTQQNPRVLLGVTAMISKSCFDKSLILSSSLYEELSFISIHKECMLFWIGIGHTLIEGKREIKLVHEIDLAYDHFYHTNSLLIRNRDPPELSLYRFKPVWRITFATPRNLKFTWNEVGN